MLRRLSLRDFVIVDELELDFAAGFTVLTGETGAGKSILIDALQLALGTRADAGVVREGAARADILAEFEPPGALAAALAPWLDEGGFEAGDSLLLRRTVDAQGKSRAWINGSPATVTQLRELGERLVDIHGQHAWQSLTRPDAVRALLDAQAQADLQPLSRAWAAWRDAARRLDDARSRHAELDRERERLQWQINELDKLAPGDDEWDELNAEHKRLSHAQGILDAARTALDAVSEGDESADSLTDRAVDALQELVEVDPQIGEAVDVLRSAQAQLRDAAHTVSAVLRRTELDPQRLATVDERLAGWMGLARRFRRQPQELPATLKAWQQELAELDAAADLGALEQAAEQARRAFDTEARRISKLRQQAAPALSSAVTQAMQTLGMAGGRFEIALRPLDEPQAHGLEAVEFLVAGHAGSTPRPLAKVASGGELSRLALAIAVCSLAGRQRDGASAPTLIFDEIDAGIGGAVAETVGRLMQRLGREAQVLAVTHLAQVAACADHHHVVAKQAQAGRTTSRIAPVAGDARVAEVARMLGGQASAAGLAHARELLDQARHAPAAQAAPPGPSTAGNRARSPADAARKQRA
ncbi:MAG: DNA repair protein RecN [Burkholderiales bacterium]|nr:DNA repair protein RecN [Burkholderiales bacterium]